MKKKIQQFEGVKILRRNEKLRAECLYILNSESVARNMYFQSKSDVVRAHIMFKRHFQPVMDFIDYLITPNGWMALVLTRSDEEIINYSKNHCTSNKLKMAVKNRDVSVILSERIRHGISGIATRYNGKNQRKGTLVSRNFSRFIFESIEHAQTVMEKMKEEQIDLCWQRKRYRPCLKQFESGEGFEENGDVFMCTKRHKSSDYIASQEVGCLQVIDRSIDVLRRIIQKTLEWYFLYKTTQNQPIQI